MPYIESFRVEGLAARPDVVEMQLNSSINAFFGPNGSGKTSLIRILHSALADDAESLESVPFSTAVVSVYTYQGKKTTTYTLSKKAFQASDESSDAPRRWRAARFLGETKKRPVWQKEPPPPPGESVRWLHEYLPTSRLYAEAGSSPFHLTYGSQNELSEAELEARFATNLTRTWREYCSDISRYVTQAQEKGLASILWGVISKYEFSPDEAGTDPNAAFVAVNNFLRRRHMNTIGRDEFLQRYPEAQFRSIVKDIEAVEKDISEIQAPREHFRDLVNELFISEKCLSFSDKELEVAIRDQKISLASLSSGEKHLLYLFVHTLLAGGTSILIDEPELSLHVDWQRRLIADLKVLSPSTQIILATHSPEIVADLSEDELHRI